MLDFSASWQQGYFRSSCGSPVVGERLSSPASNKDISGGSTVTGARLSLLSSNKDISGGSPVAGARLSLSPSGKDIFTTEQVYIFHTECPVILVRRAVAVINQSGNRIDR